MTSDGVELTRRPGAARDAPEGPVERTCKLASEVALVVLLVVIGVDIVTRWALQLLVRGVGRGRRLHAGRHRLPEPVGLPHQRRLPPGRVRPGAAVAAGALGLALDLRPARARACVLLVWQFVRLVLSSWRFGDVTPTLLETPLWIPRLPMVIGMAALCFSLLRRRRRAKRLRRSPPRTAANGS